MVEKIVMKSPYGTKLPEHNRARKVSPQFRSTFANGLRNERLPQLDSDGTSKRMAQNFPVGLKQKNSSNLRIEQMRLESVQQRIKELQKKMTVEKVNSSRDNSFTNGQGQKKDSRLPYLNKSDKRFIAKRHSEKYSMQQSTHNSPTHGMTRPPSQEASKRNESTT